MSTSRSRKQPSKTVPKPHPLATSKFGKKKIKLQLKKEKLSKDYHNRMIERIPVEELSMTCGDPDNWKFGGLIYILPYTITPFFKFPPQITVVSFIIFFLFLLLCYIVIVFTELFFHRNLLSHQELLM
jgi:hypothetical protein